MDVEKCESWQLKSGEPKSIRGGAKNIEAKKKNNNKTSIVDSVFSE